MLDDPSNTLLQVCITSSTYTSACILAFHEGPHRDSCVYHLRQADTLRKDDCYSGVDMGGSESTREGVRTLEQVLCGHCKHNSCS